MTLPQALPTGVPLDSQVKIGEKFPHAGPGGEKSSHSEISPEHCPQQRHTHWGKEFHQRLIWLEERKITQP